MTLRLLFLIFAGLVPLAAGEPVRNLVIVTGGSSASAMSMLIAGKRTGAGRISWTGAGPLKTLLEHAEERGLATGIVSTASITSPPVAACYAHVDDENKETEILAQLFTPRYGDGVDVLIGAGRDAILGQAAQAGLQMETTIAAHGYRLYRDPGAIDDRDTRVMVLAAGAFDLDSAVRHAVELLARNPKGFVLVVHAGREPATSLRNLASRARAGDTLWMFANEGGRIVTAAPGPTNFPPAAPETEAFRLAMSALGWTAGVPAGT